MRIHFVTNSYHWHENKNGSKARIQNIATLGTFKPVTLADLRRYVRVFPVLWVNT